MKDIIKSLNSRYIPFKTDVPATYLSTYRGGGKVNIVAYPESVDALSDLVRLADSEGIPYMPIGNGSDILIGDGGYDGIMISTVGFRSVRVSGNTLLAGGGAGLNNAIKTAIACGLAGMEELIGIPGTVGGAAYMNAGAFGREISDLIDSVTIFDCTKRKVRTLARREIPYAYRSSGGSLTDSVVISVTLSLAHGLGIAERAEDYIAKRRAAQPQQPSLGSVFRRPPSGISAGYYIEKAGLKGARSGGAEISRKHANFIVNRGGGTAKDYLSLAELAAQVVEKKFDIKLETEIIPVGKE